MVDNELEWFGVPLMDIIKQYGTPLRISYLPKIGDNIQRARRMFNVAMAKVIIMANIIIAIAARVLTFHLSWKSVLKHGVHLETSSAFDINIIESLYEQGQLNQIHLSFATDSNALNMLKYSKLIHQGFKNVTQYWTINSN